MKRNVLITGASGGIGTALAKTFAQNGDRVLMGCNAHPERAEETCKMLLSQGFEAMVFQADITVAKQVENMFLAVEGKYGPVDVLVNNAGISGQKMFCDISEEEWQNMFDIHVKGTFFCCQRALKSMVSRKDGCIINISSMWGQVGASCEVHYSAAKAAVIGLTQALAKEVAPSGIRVNCIAPGAIQTPMMEGFTKKEIDALCEEIPMCRLGTAEEIAGTAIFLAGNSAGYITGQIIAPNGGMIC